MSHSVLHVAFQFLIPGLIAILFFKKRWRLSWLIMILTMAVDLDHLMANPVYDSNRCSINLHPIFIPLNQLFGAILDFSS
jgi:hypothetical protein